MIQVQALQFTQSINNELIDLDISVNQMTDLTSLRSLPNLMLLSLDGNPITVCPDRLASICVF